MASVESEERVPQVQTSVDEDTNNKVEKLNSKIKNTKKKKKSNKFFPRFGCFRIDYDDTGDGFDIQVVDASGHSSNPTHLIIMVNGLIGRYKNHASADYVILIRECLLSNNGW